MHIHLCVEHIRLVSDVFASPISWIWVWVLLLTSNMSWEKHSVSLPHKKKELSLWTSSSWSQCIKSSLFPFIYQCSSLHEVCGMSGCDHKFRQHSQCSQDTRNLSLGLCHSKMFLFPIKKQRMEAIPSIGRKKPLWQTRAWSASEKQPLPIEILLPSQAGRLLNLCAGIQTARGSCAAAAPCCFSGQDQGAFVSLKRWCMVWDTLPLICPDTGNLANVTAFLKLRRAKWGWLRIAWPGLSWWLSRFRLPGEGIGKHADGIPASAFASCPCDLPVVSFNEAEQLGFGFREDEITLQLPRRQCCKIQAFKSLAQKPWRFGALFTNSVILNF